MLRGIAATGLATALLAAGAVGIPAATASPGSSEELVDLVNPFIGTKGDGNTFPGVSMPFGMVQVSPDTGHYAGYRWDDNKIRGFSVTHVSGVGCGLAGDQPMLPMIGRPASTNNVDYALPFSHETEQASPGTYRVRLDDPDGAIDVELTATQRTAKQRWTFSPAKQAGVMINTGQALHDVTSSSVKVIDSHTIETTVEGASFCQATEGYKLHLRTTFDRAMDSFSTWEGTRFSDDKESSGPGRRGVWVGFDTTSDRDVEATTAISWVDSAGAERNLQSEGTKSFEATHTAARDVWNARLGRIEITGGTRTQRRTFYSSLYRSLLGPNRGDDVDGRYRGWDNKIHKTEGHGYYQTSSLWDTYRTQIQLLALVAPEEARDQTISLILQGEQSGWLPKWGYATVETNIMTGDNVTPQIVTAHQFGLLQGWEDRAWEQLKRNADGEPPAEHPAVGRAGNDFYLRHGFVPQEGKTCNQPGDCDMQHAGSATLEYALADAAMATFAKSTGRNSEYKRYAQRSRNWLNVFTPDTNFPRARNAQGVFVSSADPAQSRGFHEGTAWQYQWLVPHDLPSLIQRLGGEAATNERLDEFFAYEQLMKNPEETARKVWVNSAYDYYGQTHYNPQNEPDLHSPYVYLWTGQPWKTADVVRAAMLLFRDGPDGITGNDDVGTMSAWHVLSSLGIYPATAGTQQLVIGSPVFETATVHLAEPFGTGDVVINAKGTSSKNRYVQSVLIDGKRHKASWFTASDLRAGATLDLEMGAAPSKWAVKGKTRAPAPVPGHGPLHRHDLFIGVTPVDATGGMAGTARSVKATATITVARPGTTRGTIVAHSPAGVDVSLDRQSFKVHGDGSPQVVTVPITVKLAADAPAGVHDVTFTVEAKGMTATDTLRLNVVDANCDAPGSQCPLDIAAAYDLDGVAPSTGENGQGNFDGLGWSFPHELLPDEGVRLVADTAMRIPNTKGTAKNFVKGPASFPVGKRVSVLTMLATASGGDAKDVEFTLHYDDGEESTAKVSLTDWCSSTPRFGNRIGIRADQRVENGKGLVAPACTLWLADIEVNPKKTLTKVTWEGDSRLRIMALTAKLG